MPTPSGDLIVANLPGQRRMLDVVRDALLAADDMAISVSFLRYSGLGLIADELKAFGARGGRVRFLTSTYMGITQPEALDALHGFDGVECRVHVTGHGGTPATGFHTKLYLFRGKVRECWVGSSNFSKGGLATNLEANLRHSGAMQVSCVEDLFDVLWARPDVVALDAAFTAAYAQALRDRPKDFVPLPLLDLPLGPATEAAPPLAGPYESNPKVRRFFVHEPKPQPNAAQLEAMERLAALRTVGENRAVVVAAPGVGKTYLAAFDAKAAGACSVLFLSHRLEHLTQAERTFRNVFGNSVSYGQLFGGHAGGEADMVFGTIASATADPGACARRFDYVVIDEFHHAAAASYRQLLARLEPRFLLGLTATPERQDGHDVLALCDFNVAYEVRLPEAINRGWLLPFHYFGICDESVDYAKIPWKSGKFDPQALENALMIQQRVDAVLGHCRERGFDGPRRATVGFCAGVRHARFMAEAFQERGLDAAFITGELPIEQREATYARFQDPHDSLEWLFVADVLNEGVDIPAINSIVFLRPTESATIFIQQLGRGLRLSPGCEVLTVLDLVGHHRAAWLTVEALADRDAPSGPSTVAELALTPPTACEIVLDVQTLAIIAKIRKQGGSRQDACIAAYRALQQESGVARPYPADLLANPDAPSMAAIRSACDSWIGLRKAAGDAQDWEQALAPTEPSCLLLKAAERDWQAPRVYGYAALWGMCARPADIVAGYDAFFERFPRWKVEYKPFVDTKVDGTLVKKLGPLFEGERLSDSALSSIPGHLLLQEIEGRLHYVLENDYRQRHGGVLRSPADLVLHRRYGRPDTVNHFGSQYDPARHNAGVLDFDKDIAILTKLDTSNAMANFQYQNRFLSPSRFSWTSQNRQRQTNVAGRRILDHVAQKRRIHLFVQSGPHEKSVYCGEAKVVSVEGNAPMTVEFSLDHPVTEAVLRDLGVTGFQGHNHQNTPAVAPA